MSTICPSGCMTQSIATLAGQYFVTHWWPLYCDGKWLGSAAKQISKRFVLLKIFPSETSRAAKSFWLVGKSCSHKHTKSIATCIFIHISCAWIELMKQTSVGGKLLLFLSKPSVLMRSQCYWNYGNYPDSLQSRYGWWVGVASLDTKLFTDSSWLNHFFEQQSDVRTLSPLLSFLQSRFRAAFMPRYPSNNTNLGCH